VSNPVFSRDPMFNGRGSSTAHATVDAATLDQMYGMPTATPRETGRMTYDDVIVRTAGLLAVIVVVGAATWLFAPGLAMIGLIGGFVLGLVNAFKKEPSPALIVAYAVFEGVFLGGISYFIETMTRPGSPAGSLALQAVMATVATFAVCLFLFRSGRVRVTPKFTRWLLVALAGYALFALTNFVLSFFIASEGFGPLRNGPIGIIVGLIAVGLASAALIVDFDAIKRGVEGGAPRKFAWSGAFGLTVTLVWLYIEFLRLIAMFTSNR
jgi:uncharacterized YccA/Bax inhibitor family protein